MHNPVATAINTTARTSLFPEKADTILLGIIFNITSNGLLELATPTCAATLSTLEVNKPKFLIVKPTIPANIKAINDVIKNPDIVL